MFCASLSNLVNHLQLPLFMINLPHPNGFGPPAVLVLEPPGVSSSSSPFRPGLSVLKQLSSEVAGTGDGPRVVEVNTRGSSPAPQAGWCVHTSSCSHLSVHRMAGAWG